MNPFKRAMTNIRRQPVKSGILLVLMVVLGALASGAISVRMAMNNTEESVLMQTPVVAGVTLDAEAAAEAAGISVMELSPEFWRVDNPTREDLSAVGSLPYVRAYDSVMMPSVFSRDLDWAMMELDASASQFESSIRGLTQWGGYVENFLTRGVANPELTDIHAGLIELVDGRVFTQADIENRSQVIIVSQLFADTNNLQVGSMMEIENNVYNYAEFARQGVGNFTAHWHYEEFMAAHQVLEFEVVGLFDVVEEFDFSSAQEGGGWEFEESLRGRAGLYNRFYIPITVAEDLIAFVNEGMLSILDEILEMSPWYQPEDLVPDEPWMESIFVLYDPRDLEAFSLAGTELLPGYWGISDLRGVNAGVVASMDSTRDIANVILFVTIGASIAVLTLVITLLLRERRHEIGVYMALGEKKRNVIVQFIIEVMVVTTVAIGISLFAGHSLSSAMSRNLLEQNLATQAAEQRGVIPGVAIPWELTLFNPGELPLEEVLELADTSLDASIMAAFAGASFAVVLASTVTPIAYVVKLEPKNVLM